MSDIRELLERCSDTAAAYQGLLSLNVTVAVRPMSMQERALIFETLAALLTAKMEAHDG